MRDKKSNRFPPEMRKGAVRTVQDHRSTFFCGLFLNRLSLDRQRTLDAQRPGQY